MSVASENDATDGDSLLRGLVTIAVDVAVHCEGDVHILDGMEQAMDQLFGDYIEGAGLDPEVDVVMGGYQAVEDDFIFPDHRYDRPVVVGGCKGHLDERREPLGLLDPFPGFLHVADHGTDGVPIDGLERSGQSDADRLDLVVGVAFLVVVTIVTIVTAAIAIAVMATAMTARRAVSVVMAAPAATIVAASAA